MTKLVCNYAAVRFLPYRETGEFVNIGVVAYCPQIDFFDFRLAERQGRRVTSFFPELDRQVFVDAVKVLKRELNSYRNEQKLVTECRPIREGDVKKGLGAFQALMQRRESLLHFAEPGMKVVDDAPAAVEELYNHFVNRTFATQPEYQEVVMMRRLASWLREWKLKDFYRRDQRIGDDDFHTTLPFVHEESNKPVKAIKPLDLDKPDTTAIYDHGDAWVQRMRRLDERHFMPKDMIFTVRFPGKPKCRGAADDIAAELRKIRAQVVPFDEPNHIQQLARV